MVLLAIPLPALADVSVGTIRGEVVDAGGAPIPSAQILVLETPHESISGRTGRFEIDVEPGNYFLEARAVGHTVEAVGPVDVSGGETAELTIRLIAVAIPLDEVVVTARYSLLREEPVRSVALDREQIMSLPHFGDDLYRATSVLPGISEGDISAQFSVRGGLYDEVLVRLDGLELFEPFHLKDFQGVFSILDPAMIGGVDLIPSGYPAEFGDRLSGVLDMRSARTRERRTSVGISFSNAWVGSSGIFAEGKGRWLGSLRRGYLDLVLRLAGEDDGDENPDPKYWDGFAKLDYDVNPRNTVSLKTLVSNDSLQWNEEDFGEVTDVETAYGNANFWVSHQSILGAAAFVDTVLSAGRVDHDRNAFYVDPPSDGVEIADNRELDIYGLRQDWNVRLTDRHYLKGGFEVRRYDVTYDYANEIQRSDPIDDPRFPPPFHTGEFADRFSGEHYSLYAADRIRLGNRFTAEVGARYDEQTLTGDRHVSPRANLVYDLGRVGLVRLGWGEYLQSHRPHELDVQFGESEFQPAEESEHWTVGYESQLAGRYTLRADAYRREVTNPRVRYEALFDPFSPFPEVKIDLIRIEADRVISNGVELYLNRHPGERFGWWVSYAYSSVEEEIGGVTQPRFNDQTHAVTASASYRPSRKWDLTAVWTYHTGWPTTAVSGELELVPGERDLLVYDIGPFYGERLPAYHRMDLRASRTSDLKSGRLTFFIDVQNLYDRDNPRGVGIEDPAYSQTADGRWVATFPEESWLGLMPSFGVSWEF